VAIPIVTLLLATAIVVAENAIRSAAAQDTRLGIFLADYVIWAYLSFGGTSAPQVTEKI